MNNMKIDATTMNVFVSFCGRQRGYTSDAPGVYVDDEGAITSYVADPREIITAYKVHPEGVQLEAFEGGEIRAAAEFAEDGRKWEEARRNRLDALYPQPIEAEGELC
jgi:hypothetical protein